MRLRDLNRQQVNVAMRREASAEEDGCVGDRVERFAVGVKPCRSRDGQMAALRGSLRSDQPLPSDRIRPSNTRWNASRSTAPSRPWKVAPAPNQRPGPSGESAR